MYYAGRGDSQPFTALALYCLVMGSVTSYVRAKAESLGMQAKVGIAERADRLVAVLLMVGLSDLLDVPMLIPVVLGVLAVASTITVVQRVLLVRSQARATV
jgi:CDP-diacylglycerol--glycerol-3-phosphate 3-phosphatidyltransferase/CDP-diacylglycerol--inositol 3-phosphatidyltransferase